MLARALLIHFPQHESLYGIGALKLGSQVIPTHNGLLGRYPGANGMKTGFVCASGFNVVASATRSGRRIVAVVMGSPNAKSRTLKAMALFEKGFTVGNFGRTSLAQLPPSGFAEAPNIRPQICGPGRNRDIAEDYGVTIAGLRNPGTNLDEGSPAAFFQQQRQATNPALVALATGELGPRPLFEPVPVYVGRAPGWAGPARQALTNDDSSAEPPAARRPASRAATQPNPHKPLPAARKAAPKSKAAQSKTRAKKQQARPAAKPAPKAAAKAGRRTPQASAPQASAPLPPAKPQAAARTSATRR